MLLLIHVRAVFDARLATAIPSTQLTEALNANEQWPWGEWRHGQKITPRGVARMLGKFQIKPRQNKHGSLYNRADFEDAWQRYATSSAATSRGASATSAIGEETHSQNNAIARETDHNTSATRAMAVADEYLQKARQSGLVALVALEKGGGPNGACVNGRPNSTTVDIGGFDAEIF